MATRKRRSTKRRVHRARSRNPVNPVNPVRRRRRRSSTRPRRHSVFARRRRNPVNPTHRRRRIGRRRHRRNPFGGGGEVIDFAGAGIFLGLAQPFASRLIGPYAQALGQFSGPVITAATGWGLSKVLEMFGLTRRFAKAARILGYSTAVIQFVQPFVARTLGAAINGGQGNGMGWARRGMGGIGMMTNVPPTGVLPPPPPPSRRSGMQGVGVRPGNYGR